MGALVTVLGRRCRGAEAVQGILDPAELCHLLLELTRKLLRCMVARVGDEGVLALPGSALYIVHIQNIQNIGSISYDLIYFYTAWVNGCQSTIVYARKEFHW